MFDVLKNIFAQFLALPLPTTFCVLLVIYGPIFLGFAIYDSFCIASRMRAQYDCDKCGALNCPSKFCKRCREKIEKH